MGDLSQADKYFLEAVVTVCRQHGRTLSHEDQQGSFMVADYDDKNIEWLMGAKRDE